MKRFLILAIATLTVAGPLFTSPAVGLHATLPTIAVAPLTMDETTSDETTSDEPFDGGLFGLLGLLGLAGLVRRR